MPLAETATTSGSTLFMLLPLVLIAAMFFFMSRQRKKQMAEQAAMLTELSPGTRVVLNSGLKGTVQSVDGDDAHIEIAPGVVATYLKGAIVRVLRDQPAAAPGDDLIPESRRDDEPPHSPIKES